MRDAVGSFFSFSSPYHLIWFVVSMTWLCVAVALRRRVWPLRYGMYFHLIVTLDAVFTLDFLTSNHVYSIHCVWFNALLTGVHYLLLRRTLAKTDDS